jgi:hypothetical protein
MSYNTINRVSYQHAWRLKVAAKPVDARNHSLHSRLRSSAIVQERAESGPVLYSSSERRPSIVAEVLPPALEPFVTAKEAAAFLRIASRRLLEMARSGQLPAHPIGCGKRHTWRFRLSELAQAIVSSKPPRTSATIFAGRPSVPGQEK